MKCIRSTFFIFLALLLNGCTIVTYELRDELPTTKNVAPCNIIFSFNLQSGHYTNSFGEKPDEIQALKALEKSYIKSTLRTLNDLGCSASQASSIAKSNFTVNVSRQSQLSALPQEWLTGLSLGIIPSWGTKYEQYVFTFTHNDSGQAYSYRIDQNNYNHLILFPVFWITFFTADEQSAYTRALTNFIESF